MREPSHATREMPMSRSNSDSLLLNAVPANASRFKCQGDGPNTGCACESGGVIVLICPIPGYLISSIDQAMYGREESSTCPCSLINAPKCFTNSTTCSQPKTPAIIQGLCLGKASCTIVVNYNVLGGDPCQYQVGLSLHALSLRISLLLFDSLHIVSPYVQYKYLMVAASCSAAPLPPGSKGVALGGTVSASQHHRHLKRPPPQRTWK